jgi:RNA polymerase sigma-70 factor (ECF subfamily)
VTDFEALYRRYAPQVFRFALYLSGNRGEAEDITSETFVRAWTSAAPIRTATVKGYLFTIARHLHLEGLRRSRRHVEIPDTLKETLADPRMDSEARAERDSELAAALRALQRLPEIDRAALLMRAADDMPYEEIARALGLSLASVKVRIHRARLALRDPGERIQGESP